MSAPARPDRPRLRDRYDRKQQQIVRAAAKVFAERGYDQTTIQDLAEASDWSAGAIYHYVSGKEQLLALICDQLMDPLNERAAAMLAIEQEPADQLRALVRLWLAHATEHRDHMLVFLQERHVIERGAQWREQRASRKRFERRLEEVVSRVHAEGRLRLADERLALSALLGMVNHTVQWYRPRGRLTPAAIADGYAELLLKPGSA